jgi:hypothetical protein
MPKSATQISNAETKKNTSSRKLSDVRTLAATKTDAPEFIKSGELETKFPFTIYGASEKSGQYGDRIYFQVAWKDTNGEVIKRVWTPTANDERRAIMREVKKSAITNCRVVAVPTNGQYDYYKIIDADADVDAVIAEALELLKKDNDEAIDNDIPF